MKLEEIKSRVSDFVFAIVAVMVTAFLISVIWGGCATAPQVPTPLPSPAESVRPAGKKCPAFVKTGIKFVNRQLPDGWVSLRGPLVLESHLVSVEDALTSFPKSGTDQIQKHLDLSCARLKQQNLVTDCSKVYSNRYVKQWTPSESGAIGQGSIGKKPPLDCEMWTVNMYWTGATRPKPGTKFMIGANGKRVIACAGYETGPGSASFVGGAQGEVFWHLGITNKSQVVVGQIDDQSLPYGPLECEE